MSDAISIQRPSFLLSFARSGKVFQEVTQLSNCPMCVPPIYTGPVGRSCLSRIRSSEPTLPGPARTPSKNAVDRGTSGTEGGETVVTRVVTEERAPGKQWSLIRRYRIPGSSFEGLIGLDVPMFVTAARNADKGSTKVSSSFPSRKGHQLQKDRRNKQWKLLYPKLVSTGLSRETWGDGPPLNSPMGWWTTPLTCLIVFFLWPRNAR